MAAANEELCRRVERKADELVNRRRRGADAASGALSSAQGEAASAERGRIDGGSVACGCVAVPVIALIVGAALEVVVGLFAGGVLLGLFQGGFFLVGLIIAVGLVVYFVSSSSRAHRANAGVGTATDDDAIARRKLEDAEALRRSVRTAVARLRAAASDGECRLARSEIERLEREIDAER